MSNRLQCMHNEGINLVIILHSEVSFCIQMSTVFILGKNVRGLERGSVN